MFQFVGYNFFGDGDALNYAPTVVDNISTTTIKNAIFDHMNVTRNSTALFDNDKPEWDFDTILDTTFDNTINAGNVDFLVSQITSLKIKRRIKGTFDWMTLKILPIDTVEDLTFAFNDLMAVGNVEYEYALVPVLGNTEGDYIVESILAQFNGVFIGDTETVYKMLFDVNYANNKRNQQLGTFEPLGRKYPIIVANGNLSFDSGAVTSAIINDDFEATGQLDVDAITKKKELMKSFLTNHKPKILRDWNGNSWLCFITDAPQISYAQNSGMRIPYVSFSWAEIGDLDNKLDLFNNGLIDEV